MAFTLVFVAELAVNLYAHWCLPLHATSLSLYAHWSATP